jgi:hypothetical protein
MLTKLSFSLTFSSYLTRIFASFTQSSAQNGLVNNNRFKILVGFFAAFLRNDGNLHFSERQT